jgi:hypothetical protein
MSWEKAEIFSVFYNCSGIKLRAYILTQLERQLLRKFLEEDEFTSETRTLLSRSADAYEQLLSDILLVLDGLIRFEKMRKHERT